MLPSLAHMTHPMSLPLVLWSPIPLSHSSRVSPSSLIDTTLLSCAKNKNDTTFHEAHVKQAVI